MTDATFQARFVKSIPRPYQSVIQVIFEVPAEHDQHVCDVLGGMMPKPGKEVWVGIARLNSGLNGEAGSLSPNLAHSHRPRTPEPYSGGNDKGNVAQRDRRVTDGDCGMGREKHPSAAADMTAGETAHNSDRAESPLAPETGEASHPTDAPGAAPPPRRFTSLPLPQQAALLCKDNSFISYVGREYGVGVYVNTPDDTSEWLRLQCGVQSRRELTPDSAPGREFVRIREKYLTWKHSPELCDND